MAIKDLLPLLLFPAKTKSEAAWMTLLLKQKKIRKVGPKLYTSVPKSAEKNLIRNQWSQIIQALHPEALLSHRSALEYKPTSNDVIILTSTTNKVVKYPGLTLYFVRGPKPRSGDINFLNFKASSLARAYLENLSASAGSIHVKCLTSNEIEIKLEQLLQAKGEIALNDLRDHAKKIAKDLKWPRQYKKLNQIISAMLGTKKADGLTSASAISRSKQKPFDLERIARFDLLFSSLKSTPLKEYTNQFKNADHFRHKAFFESYFSNYIEGTTFEIEEAENIIFDGHIPKDRPLDAHDILGTFQIVSDPNEYKKTPHNISELESLLKHRHFILMGNRNDVSAGHYKTKPNRAGDTHFVPPELIQGTLHQAFDRYQNLDSGLARAIFMMFMISEIHPFVDGNGRIARIMMNAELFSDSKSLIIIPNVYREDYLLSLRALTRRDRTEPYIRMMSRAHMFSNLDFTDYKKILKEIELKNWFREPKEAKLVE